MVDHVPGNIALSRTPSWKILTRATPQTTQNIADERSVVALKFGTL